MRFLCCECGKKFNGSVKHEGRVCPECKSEGSEHVAEVCNSLDADELADN